MASRFQGVPLEACPPRGQLVTQDPTTAKRIALPSDDGRGPQTEKLLEMLARHRVRATFYLSGELVALKPETARRTLERGPTFNLGT